ncbi:MAG: hypothetical protein IPK60_20730 [Sandaracinaceae bacterium]|nr:hypothetical protein [Sandaracinaceae bacterium]
MAAKTKKNTRVESITLAELTKRFMVHLDESGKSDGTRFSYLMELKLAQNELGAETQLSALTADAIAAFNASERVTTLKNGKPKSQLSIDKSRRVLRQALTFAHTSGWLAERAHRREEGRAHDERRTRDRVGREEQRAEEKTRAQGSDHARSRATRSGARRERSRSVARGFARALINHVPNANDLSALRGRVVLVGKDHPSD